MPEVKERDYAAEFKARRFASVAPDAAAPVNQNFHSGHVTKDDDGKDVYPWATDVLANRLSNFATYEMIAFEERQNAIRTGQVLRLPEETITAYKARRKKWNEEHKKIPTKSLVMNPSSAREQLARFERTYRTKTVDWTNEKQAEAAREDFSFMNGCRDILGMEPFDYENEAMPQVTIELEERFAAFEKIPEADARIAKCATVEDGDLMRLVAIKDPDQKVRNEAEKRYGQLLMRSQG
jgi:hypothetical protein